MAGGPDTVRTLIPLAFLLAVVTAPVAAQDVTYQKRSSVSFGGAMDRVMGLAERFGGGSTETLETQYIKGARVRSDREGSSTILDMENGRIVVLNHDARTYVEMSLDSMMMAAQAMAGNMERPMEGAGVEAREGRAGVPGDVSFDASVDRTGETGSVAGYDAERVLITLDMDMSTVPEEQIEEGGTRVVVLTDMWVSQEVPGYEALGKLQEEYGAGMAASASSMGDAMAGAFAGDANQRAAMERAAEEMAKVEGMPVRTTTHLVTLPLDAEFDREMALEEDEGEDEEGASAGDVAKGLMSGLLGRKKEEPEEEEPEEEPETMTQITLFTVMEELVEVDTSPVPESLFRIPEGYRPMEMGR